MRVVRLLALNYISVNAGKVCMMSAYKGVHYCSAIDILHHISKSGDSRSHSMIVGVMYDLDGLEPKKTKNLPVIVHKIFLKRKF